MTPSISAPRSAAVLRREFLWSIGLSAVCGCANPLIRGQNPDPAELTQESVEDPATATRLVRDVSNSTGLQSQKVESIALVTQLAGTGSDPPAGQQRQTLIDEMQTHDVRNPNQLLASPNTSLVLVRGFLPPGVQKGDRIDVEVRVKPVVGVPPNGASDVGESNGRIGLGATASDAGDHREEQQRSGELARAAWIHVRVRPK